uniref:Receptor protein-tyrosine kinase n=1 Tax=Caenorhabditis tropicalis TaxID=1561998 RepID=A0A1I7TCN5_9PELO
MVVLSRPSISLLSFLPVRRFLSHCRRHRLTTHFDKGAECISSRIAADNMYSVIANFKQFINPILFILLFSSLVQCGFVSTSSYRTLLYGEKLKGFLTISPADENGDTYIVSFDIKEKPNDTLVWAVHTSSAPYDMAVMTDNCRRVKKSPPVVKNMPVTDSTINGDGLAGNTLVISGDNSEVLACATVIIPGKQLMHASFHQEPIEGHVHIIPIKNNAVRLVPDLKYMPKYDYVEPEKKIMTWAFVDSCVNANDSTKQTDYSEVGVDSRATFAFELPENYTLEALALYREDKLFACADIVNVEPRTLKSLGVTLRQNHYFEPVIGLKSPPTELHIRDDCLDISTEIIHKNYLDYYPSVNIFGSESIMLKSLVLNGSCSALRPQFARPAAIANFLHPIIGRIALVDTDDKILLTGEIRNIFDEMSTRATVLVSNKTAESTSCTHTTCETCHRVENAAVVVGKNEKAVTLTGVFNWFNISDMRSAIIDLEWMKVCANLTVLPSGALTMHAMVKRVAPFSSATVASVVALEYPANNYTEILINKNKNSPMFKHISDLWIVVSQVVLHVEIRILEVSQNVIFDENFVTGATSMLGTSILLKDGKEVFCGHFEPPCERFVAFAEFGHPFDGYIKMTQYVNSNWESGFPTEIYYSLKYSNQTDPTANPESVSWEIVSDQNLTCSTAVIFNPLQVDESECTSQRYEFCPIGSAANRSKPLLMHARWHLTAQSFPLSGPYSVIGKTLRLRSIKNQNQIGCYPVKRVSEATFRWVVYTNTSLSTVQNRISKKTGVPTFKIEVDYTRELYQTRCTIFRITILENDEKLEKILDSFDVEARKFNNDTELICSGTQPLSTEASDAISQNIITSSSIPLPLVLVLLSLSLRFL